MAIPISTHSPGRVSIVASADEAISLTRATEIFQADTFISSALMSLQNAKPVLDRFAQLSQISSLISKQSSGFFLPLSVAGLESTEKTTSALRSFFNQDGPVLGETLAEANTNYATLLAFGIQITAPVKIPVLIELDSKDGKPPAKSIDWYSSEQITSLSVYPEIGASGYPGSVLRVSNLKDANGKVVQTTRYTIFEDYANRRSNITAMAEGLRQLTEVVEDVVKQVALELKFAQRAGAEADRKLDLAETFKSEIGAFMQKIESAANELIEAALRLRQFLYRERQLLMTRQDEVLEREKITEGSSTSLHQFLDPLGSNNFELDSENHPDTWALEGLCISEGISPNFIKTDPNTSQSSMVTAPLRGTHFERMYESSDRK